MEEDESQHRCYSALALLEKHNAPNEKGLPTAVAPKPSRNYTARKPLLLRESNRSNWSVLQRIWLDL